MGRRPFSPAARKTRLFIGAVVPLGNRRASRKPRAQREQRTTARAARSPAEERNLRNAETNVHQCVWGLGAPTEGRILQKNSAVVETEHGRTAANNRTDPGGTRRAAAKDTRRKQEPAAAASTAPTECQRPGARGAEHLQLQASSERPHSRHAAQRSPCLQGREALLPGQITHLFFGSPFFGGWTIRWHASLRPSPVRRCCARHEGPAALPLTVLPLRAAL